MGMNAELLAAGASALSAAITLRMEHRLTKIETRCTILCPPIATPTEAKHKRRLNFLVGFCALVIIAALVGCSSLVPTDRAKRLAVREQNELATQATTTIRKQTPPTSPPISITSAGSSNTVTLTMSPARDTFDLQTTRADVGKAALQDNSKTTVSIPFAVKLILLAVGVAALVGAITLARRSSVAADAAYKAADSALAAAIDRANARAVAALQPNEVATNTAERAELEKARGKLAAQAK